VCKISVRWFDRCLSTCVNRCQLSSEQDKQQQQQKKKKKNDKEKRKQKKHAGKDDHDEKTGEKNKFSLHICGHLKKG